MLRSHSQSTRALHTPLTLSNRVPRPEAMPKRYSQRPQGPDRFWEASEGVVCFRLTQIAREEEIEPRISEPQAYSVDSLDA